MSDLLKPVRATRYRIREHDGALLDIPGFRGRGFFVKAQQISELIDALQDIEDDIMDGA